MKTETENTASNPPSLSALRSRTSAADRNTELPPAAQFGKGVRSPARMKNLPSLFLTATLLAAGFMAATPALGALKTWTGSAADMLWSSGGNWSSPGAPGTADNVTFTNLDFAANPIALGGSVNNIVDAGFGNSVNSLSYMNTNGFHNTQVINNLSVIGTSATDVANIADDGEPSIFFVGSGQWQDLKDDSVYATITGNSLTVSNGNANLSVSQISMTAGAHRATLDLTGLNSFTCVVSNVLVGHNFTIVDHAWRPCGTLSLAQTNSITTRIISVADVYQNSPGGVGSIIHLGQVNTLNADQVRIGMHKCPGTVDFTPLLNAPSVIFRNAAGTGRQNSWELGDMYEPNTNTIGFFSSGNAVGAMNLTGATVDALVDRITLGRGQIQVSSVNRAGDGVGTLTFGGGTIDANFIEMGIQVNGPFIGGSVGRGTINVNNDAGVGPALLTVRSNIVMAVQYPGATTPDAIGSEATINVKDGSTVAVAGDIVSGGPGGGTATISLSGGGKLDMKPTGDATPGNVSISVLNIDVDSIITNYDTLSLKSIVFPVGLGEFTVYPSQTIAAVRVGTIGPLDVSGDLNLEGTTLLDIAKNGATLTSDIVRASGTIALGGTVKVTWAGPPTDLVVGDKFTLFNAHLLLGAPNVLQLPPPGSGLAWKDNIAADGTIEVIACGCGEPLTPPTVTVSASPTSLHLSWPTAYTSFKLRGQTNSVSVGLGTNWGLVPGVAGNQVTIPINPANGSVFFQLFQQ